MKLRLVYDDAGAAKVIGGFVASWYNNESVLSQASKQGGAAWVNDRKDNLSGLVCPDDMQSKVEAYPRKRSNIIQIVQRSLTSYGA